MSEIAAKYVRVWRAIGGAEYKHFAITKNLWESANALSPGGEGQPIIFIVRVKASVVD